MVTRQRELAAAGKRANPCRAFQSRVCGLCLALKQASALDLQPLATALRSMGCPPEKCQEMAAQLDKRARQLAEQKQTSYEAAMEHLLKMMGQGWAAKERGMQ